MLSYVPNSLEVFLKSSVPARNTSKDKHYAGIGQSIIQMIRPRSILCPLQVILGAEGHRRTGWAYKLGFFLFRKRGTKYVFTSAFRDIIVNHNRDPFIFS